MYQTECKEVRFANALLVGCRNEIVAREYRPGVLTVRSPDRVEKIMNSPININATLDRSIYGRQSRSCSIIDALAAQTRNIAIGRGQDHKIWNIRQHKTLTIDRSNRRN